MGAGVMGLSAAVRLQDAGFTVTIIAEKRSPHTASDYSGAIIRPDYLGNTAHESVLRWSRETAEHMLELSGHSQHNGVTMVPAYEFFPTPTPPQFWRDTVLGYRECTKQELIAFAPRLACGFFYITFVVECRNKYMEFLERQFMSRGGQFIAARLNELSEVDKFVPLTELIVNCSGLSGLSLVGAPDDAMKPVRGQTVVVRCPSCKFAYGDYYSDPARPTYVYPRGDEILLGGCYLEGDEDCSIDDSLTRDIIERCAAFHPDLAESPILAVRVGHRPSRPTVRCEREVVQLGGRTVGVVHNYGHGGAGVTVHWGCAGDCVALVEECAATLQLRHTAQLPTSMSSRL